MYHDKEANIYSFTLNGCKQLIVGPLLKITVVAGVVVNSENDTQWLTYRHSGVNRECGIKN